MPPEPERTPSPPGREAAAPHTLLDDVQALLAGTLLVSLGVALLGRAHLVSGGVVGLVFLLHYLTGIGFGKLFFAVNLPFYVLAVRKMGWEFTLKTFCAVLLLSIFSELLPRVLRLESIHPLYAAVMGGLLMGVGLLILFRHKASLGGLNVLVLYVEERTGWRAGLVQLGFDAVILLSSALTISVGAVAISMLGAAVLNLSLAINHRRERYTAI